MKNNYDVLIIGGGPGGLSSALTLARGGRSVVVFDDDKPRNSPAAHMQNFPSRDGLPPSEFRQLVKAELNGYGVDFISERVNTLERIADGFVANGIKGKKVMLAHGVKDLLPDIPGLKELWGKSVFHCPYCHGHEHKNTPMGMIGGQFYADHMGPLIKGLTPDVMLFANGEKVEGLHYPVYESPIKRLIHQGEQLTAVELMSGEIIKRSYLFIRPPQQLTTDLGVKLGCELTKDGLFVVDEMGKTTQEGVYAAGDIVQMRQSVLMACASGQLAGASMNFEIQKERAL